MINITLHLNLPSATCEKVSVVTVYYKNRMNIIGTCAIEQTESKTIGSLTIAEALLDNLYVFYILSSKDGKSILDGILLDDISLDKTIDTVGSIKLNQV